MESATEEATGRVVLFETQRHLTLSPRVHYIDYRFEVPEGASRVGLAFSYHRETVVKIFVSLHDLNGFRGNRMKPGARGEVGLELWVAPDSASEGGLPGPLPAGEWLVRVDIEALHEETDIRLEVYAEFREVPESVPFVYPTDHVVKPGAGWYRGELHAHSTESDGKYPVETVVQAAIDAGLDFFSLSDHFTISQWRKLAPLVNDRTALLRSCEITSHQGHANLHGISKWVDVYVDRPSWDMNQAADAVHEQGGLFCVNHAFSGDLGWRAHDFDWSRADLMEVYHNLEGANNNLQPPLWDHYLRLGRRIIGVGGVDSHDPFEGLHKLGEVVTWVYAPELSERGIVQGLKDGRVYVSRGPELRFSAINAAGERAEMWESLPLTGEPVTFEVQVRCGQPKGKQPLRVFMLKNGYPFESMTVEAQESDWQTLTFVDQPERRAYYRLELHSIYQSELHPYLQWRDFNTMQVLSNPIWIGLVEA